MGNFIPGACTFLAAYLPRRPRSAAVQVRSDECFTPTLGVTWPGKRMEEAMRHSLCLIIAVLMVGCSNSQIYNAIQENRRFECSKLPQNQYEECLRKYDTSYTEYERERQALRKGEASQ